MILVGEIMTQQSKSLQPAATTVSAGSEYQQSLSADDPILVSLEGTYQQQPVQLGNDKYIFLAAKVRNANVNNRDKITTFFLQQARELAARSESLPLDQQPTVPDVGGNSPDIALFGLLNTTAFEFLWFYIRYGPNTGPGAPGGSISVDSNGRELRCGDWECVPITHHAGELPFIYFNYADNDANGIAGYFSLTPANPGGGCRR